MTQTITNNSEKKLAHLVVQLQQKFCLTQEQVAMALGIRRSSFARYVSTKEAFPRKWKSSACEWIARSLSLTRQQVEHFVEAKPLAAAPMALLELDATQYFQIDEHAPRQLGTALTRRWKNAAVTMICPLIPPKFLLTKRLINVLDRNQNPIDSLPAECYWSHRMHRQIAGQIWLSRELLPAHWEMIIPERTIDLMRSISGSFSGASDEMMTELAEIWHHDLIGECKLAIRVLPECDEAVPILRHFSDARTVVFVDGVYRWKELCDQKRVHVTTIDSVSCNNDALKWDRQIIDLARSLCIDHRPRGHSISLLGNLCDHRQEALQLRTHPFRLSA